jgi:hypothetical protein
MIEKIKFFVILLKMIEHFFGEGRGKTPFYNTETRLDRFKKKLEKMYPSLVDKNSKITSEDHKNIIDKYCTKTQTNKKYGDIDTLNLDEIKEIIIDIGKNMGELELLFFYHAQAYMTYEDFSGSGIFFKLSIQLDNEHTKLRFMQIKFCEVLNNF